MDGNWMMPRPKKTGLDLKIQEMLDLIKIRNLLQDASLLLIGFKGSDEKRKQIRDITKIIHGELLEIKKEIKAKQGGNNV